MLYTSPLEALFSMCEMRMYVRVLIAQSHPTLCSPIDCSSPVSSVHEIFFIGRILEWATIPLWGDLSELRIGPKSPLSQLHLDSTH